MDRRSAFRKFLYLAEGLLLLGCGGLYLLDLIFGNGDGVIDQLKINVFTIFVCVQVLLLLLYGISSSRSILSNLSISLMSLLVMLFVAEVGFRFLSTTHRKGITVKEGPYYYKSFDPVFFKTNHPNCSFSNTLSPVDGGATISIKINSQGIRGPEIPAKKEGQKRLLLIGDSFIQAIQVPYKETIGEQIKSSLSDSISIFQHGFPSYSPLLEFNWLLRKGIHFEPDQVLLFIYMNDFYSGRQVGDAGYWPHTKFDKNGYPAGFTFDAKKPPEKRTPFSLLLQDINRSALLKWGKFQLRLGEIKAALPIEQFDHILQLPKEEFTAWYQKIIVEGDPFRSFNWDLMAGLRDTSLWGNDLVNRIDKSLSILKHMDRFLSQKNISFGVVFIPFPWQLKDEGRSSKKQLGFAEVTFPYSGLQAKFQQFCQSEQIPFLDLYPDFVNYKREWPDRHLYFPHDQHWTAAGHQLAAEKVYDFFLSPSTIKE